ncbi:pirin family protein [Parasediminibacterium sp. JCM 36343]|uniref:pirin family protein n=1 Tax=Parasediminibacterium sp. JCM 36343 TaxID=3374279 RepID=UPI00397B9A18
MKHTIFNASERGLKDIGWLKSNFTFSFSSYANPLRNGFGLLKVFNDDFVEAGKGFGLHPHQNMEIISVLLAGNMNHKDSIGYTDVVSKDWVQIMSAGSGLRHEEYNVGENEVNFLQIWIEPKLQNINPRYQRRFFPKESRVNTLKTVISNEEGAQHCWINQNAKLSLGYYTEKTEFTYTLNPVNKCVFIFVIEGRLNIDGTDINKRDAIGIWETSEIPLHIEPNSEFIVIEVPINH